MEIVERIEELIKRSGKSANAVLTECKLSHNSITAWKGGKAKPSLDAIVKLADYFNVTVDFIVGREQKPMPTSQEILFSKMNADEIKFVNTYRAMPLISKLTMKMFILTNPLMWAKKSNKNDLMTKEEIALLKKLQEDKN